MTISYNHSGITIINGRYHVVYGDSEIDPITGEWNMAIYKDGKEKARYLNSELLEISNGERPVDLVLAGICRHFLKG